MSNFNEFQNIFFTSFFLLSSCSDSSNRSALKKCKLWQSNGSSYNLIVSIGQGNTRVKERWNRSCIKKRVEIHGLEIDTNSEIIYDSRIPFSVPEPKLSKRFKIL